MNEKVGALQGRFQGLHMGHMEFLLEAKKRCDFLIIGITNFDIGADCISCDSDVHRLRSDANPFSFYERMMMIRLSLQEADIGLDSFAIVPFPIEKPEKIYNFVPDDVTFFQTVYDEWGEKKVKALADAGYKTEVMWTRTDDDRFSSGSEVRELMACGGNWEALVPKACARFIKENGLDKRLQAK